MKVTSSSALIQGEPLATVLFEPDNHESDVVLVHGFTGSKEDFTEVAELLAVEGYRVLTFDNRGQYESSHTRRADGYSMHSLGKDVIELAIEYNLDKPHLLGHSFGGLIAQEAIVQSPSTWKSLTLMCSGPAGQPEWTLPDAFDHLLTKSMESIWIEHFDQERKAHPRYEIQKKRWLASHGLATSTFSEHLKNQPSHINEIAKNALPAHVIYGERDDAWPLELQNQMAKDLAASVTILRDCGHCPNEDNPRLTSDSLISFWNSI